MALYQLAQLRRALLIDQLAAPTQTGNAGYREHYRRISQEAATDIYHTVRHSALLDTVLDAAVQRVFRQIQAANPAVAGVGLVLARNPEPNAYAAAAPWC